MLKYKSPPSKLIYNKSILLTNEYDICKANDYITTFPSKSNSKVIILSAEDSYPKTDSD
jgi:hypothetical protein